MSVWTKEQYLRFSRAIMDKPDSWMVFELLYWTGIREGELLALTPEDIDIDGGTLSVTKTYARRRGKDVVTPPKTPKSNRRVVMPDFLVIVARLVASAYEDDSLGGAYADDGYASEVRRTLSRSGQH